GFVFAVEIFHRVLVERNSRITTLLRAPVDQAFFTNVEITGTGTTTPVIRLAFGDAVLEPVQTRMVLVSEFLDLLEDVLFFYRQRLQRSINVVNYANCG